MVSDKFLDLSPKDLAHAAEVHAHAEVAVAAELVEAVGPQVDRHQGDVRVVHGLEGAGNDGHKYN